MNNAPPSLSIDPVFKSRSSITLQLCGAIAIGLFLYAIGAVTFIISLITPPTPGHNFEPGSDPSFFAIIGCSVIGSFSFIAAFFLLRSSRRVTLGADLLTVDTFLSRNQLRWTDIGSANHAKRSVAGLPASRVLEIQDRAGKTRLVVTDAIADFDALADVIIARIGAVAGPAAIDQTLAEERRIAKESRKSRILAAFFLLFTLGMAAGFIAGINEEMHIRRYATEGVRVDAAIKRAYLYSITPHVEFSFQDATGRTYSRDAMMFTGPEWDKAQQSKTIPVIYLPSDPSWNRLVTGEDDTSFGGNFLFITGGGILMFGFFFVLCALGYNLKTEDGMTQLVRRGVVIKEWGAGR